MVVRRLTEIFTRQENESRNDDDLVKSASTRTEQCLSCRLIGGGGLITFGFTILYYTRKNALLSSLPKSRLQLFIGNLGGVIVTSFGVIRLLDLRIPSITAEADRECSH